TRSARSGQGEASEPPRGLRSSIPSEARRGADCCASHPETTGRGWHPEVRQRLVRRLVVKKLVVGAEVDGRHLLEAHCMTAVVSFFDGQIADEGVVPRCVWLQH